MAGRPRPVLVHSGLFMQGGAAPARKLLIALWSNAAEVRKQLPLRLFMLKTIILPRQARDKHRESTQIKGCVLSQCLVRMARALPLDRQVRRLKQTLAGDMYDPATGRTYLYIKCIILPRQARDEHRENSKKSAVFPQMVYSWLPPAKAAHKDLLPAARPGARRSDTRHDVLHRRPHVHR